MTKNIKNEIVLSIIFLAFNHGIMRLREHKPIVIDVAKIENLIRFLA